MTIDCHNSANVNASHDTVNIFVKGVYNCCDTFVSNYNSKMSLTSNLEHRFPTILDGSKKIASSRQLRKRLSREMKNLFTEISAMLIAEESSRFENDQENRFLPTRSNR